MNGCMDGCKIELRKKLCIFVLGMYEFLDMEIDYYLRVYAIGWLLQSVINSFLNVFVHIAGNSQVSSRCQNWSRSFWHGKGKSVSQPVSQAASQSVSLSARQSDCQSANQLFTTV